jgi:murein DD-endopeptidase MepM/ murein hydrolase activator NlpD
VIGAVVASAVIGSASTAGASNGGEATADEVQLTPVTQRVATPPRWFPGDDGRVNLQYEVLLTNTIPLPVDVTEVQVLGDGHDLTTLSGTELAAALAPLGSAEGSGTMLPGSSSAVVWVDLTLASADDVPRRVSQRLTVDVGPGLPVEPTITATGGRAAVDRRKPVVLDPPLRGGGWVAIGGADGPHRRALQAVDGTLRLSQRFAVDFSALLDGTGRTHAGDPDQNASYFNTGQAVLAVADGTVVEAVDGLPDQVANHAVDLPAAQQDGNHVILRLARDVYVGYAHLAPGTVRVRAGDRVRAGAVLGRLGNSGSSSGPHLHLQVMDRPSFLAADGLPFVFSRFTTDGTIPSLEGFVDEDRAGAPVQFDAADAGRRRDRGIAGLEVVTFAGRARAASARGDVTGVVGVGRGRRLFVECRGSGSPTVVLISGKGTDAADWMQIADPTDPALQSPTDDVGAGLVKQVVSDDAVFPSVARFTRVCAYDRPDTRLTGDERSTPRARQPHSVDQDVRDLHRLLRALDEPGPYVLVPHSYGGWIAELYARTYPKRIGGLVMVDAATALLRDVMTPAQLKNWDATNRMTSPQLAEGVRVIDAIDQVRAAGPMPKVPAIVLTADKPYRTDLLPPGTDPDASLTFADWRKAQDRLATALRAEHVTSTASGHHVYLYSPAIVVDAIRAVVDDVRVREEQRGGPE